MTEDQLDFDTVLETRNPGLLLMAESLLRATGIEYRVQGRGTTLAYGFALGVLIQVRKRDLTQTAELLSDLEESSLDSEWPDETEDERSED